MKLEPQSGDKQTRAMPLVSQASGGNVSLVSDDRWNDDFLRELTGFPTGAHDDMVDAASSAFTRLTGGTLGILEFYARQYDEQQAKEERERAALAANGGVLPALIVVEENDVTDLALALTGAKRPPPLA